MGAKAKTSKLGVPPLLTTTMTTAEEDEFEIIESSTEIKSGEVGVLKKLGKGGKQQTSKKGGGKQANVEPKPAKRQKTERTKKGGGAVKKRKEGDGKFKLANGQLVINEDRSKSGIKTLGGSVTYKFFDQFHRGYKPMLNGGIYQFVEASSIGFPPDTIICRFLDGRYRIWLDGIIWSSINVAATDLGVEKTR